MAGEATNRNPSFDFFLSDERFRQEKNVTYISKWIRKSIRQHDNFNQSLEGLKLFFRDVKVENNGSYMKPMDVEPIDVEEPINWFTEMKNSKLTKPKLEGQSSVSDGVTAPKAEEYDLKDSKAQRVRPFKMSVNNTGIAYVDLEDDLEAQDRCSSPAPIILSPDDLKETPRDNDRKLLIKKETPIKEICPITLESDSEHELSNSTIFQTKFPDQQLPHSPCSTSASAFVTPNKQYISQNRSPLLDMSVTSRFHKRRKPSVVKMEPLDSPMLTETMEFSVPQSCILEVPETSSTTFGDVMKKAVKISCSVCRHPLGLEVNNYIVPCSIMSLSKMHLASIWKGELKKPVSVPVAVSDITSVDTRISETSPEQGIWSKEDGCVFNKIICTFCSNKENCLGLHVVATNSSNVQLLNKVLFYYDRLEIQHIDTSRNKEFSPSSVTSGTKSLVQDPDPFEKYAPETNSGGWQTTKSKMGLLKKDTDA